jgi:hypothetical protein
MAIDSAGTVKIVGISGPHGRVSEGTEDFRCWLNNSNEFLKWFNNLDQKTDPERAM